MSTEPMHGSLAIFSETDHPPCCSGAPCPSVELQRYSRGGYSPGNTASTRSTLLSISYDQRAYQSNSNSILTMPQYTENHSSASNSNSDPPTPSVKQASANHHTIGAEAIDKKQPWRKIVDPKEQSQPTFFTGKPSTNSDQKIRLIAELDSKSR